MAIDSAEKRRAAAGAFGFPRAPGVTPNASPDKEWRFQAAWSYDVTAGTGGGGGPTLGEAKGDNFIYHVWGFMGMGRYGHRP